MGAKNQPNEIYINRIYDAPVETVWRAWVDPKEAAQWWGPRGFTLTTHSKDFRIGGCWRYTMHGPDGVDYPNITTYLEIEKYSRLVYDHGATDVTPPVFRVTVDFANIHGKTKMEMRMALPTANAANETKKFIKKAGGDATWDRLAEYLSPTIKFVINRSFDAPIELVYKMWIDPNHVSKWLPPVGATMKFIRADIKVGHSTFYCMESSYGVMYGRTQYREIVRPHRIVYTQQFVDEHENIARHPLAPTWPETMLTTVVLSEEDSNRTRVTVTWEPHGPTTTEEIEIFKTSRGGMTQGWSGSFDKFEESLINQAN